MIERGVMSVEVEEIESVDFPKHKHLPVPTKRAAYSDRTAWLMAVMSELAYVKFEEEEEANLLQMAGELAEITNENDIKDKLVDLKDKIRTGGISDNSILEKVLSVGGYELHKPPIFDPETDTQGFVAFKRESDGPGMAVLAFRGTEGIKKIEDWMTNLKAMPEPVRGNWEADEDPGRMHKGFMEAFLSVEQQIDAKIEQLNDLPLYITGHSLGGALAVVATWHIKSENLAACYTFGAPRVGENKLIDLFKTPIYRIVNGPDPVPFVPPTKLGFDLIKYILRVLPITYFQPLIKMLIKVQGFRHYGYMRYVTVPKPGKRVQVAFHVSSWTRFTRYLKLRYEGKSGSLVKYHEIARYRQELRDHAILKNSRPII